MLTANQITDNYKTFREIINDNFPSRKDSLNRLYDALEEDDRIQMAPASSYEFFHNAIPGGYIDHVLRVYYFAIETFEFWQKLGMKIDNFTLEELQFSAIHHDLGKMGLIGFGRENYLPETEKWWKENRGRMYKHNPNVPWMKTNDVTLYLLNQFQIPYSLNEMLAIKLTDGMFEEENKKYFSGFDLETKLRCNLPYILHHADIAAYRFEFEQWATESEKFLLENEKLNIQVQAKTNNQTNKELDAFEEFFKNK